MRDFIQILNEAMQAQGLSARGLEKKMKEIFGPEMKISGSAINDHLNGKDLPLYQAGYMISVALGLDETEALGELFKARMQHWERFEKARYDDMLKYIERQKA